MSVTDAANALLGCVLDHKRGDDVAANVRAFRDLPLSDSFNCGVESARGGFHFDIPFMKSATFGEALDGVMLDIQNGDFARLEGAGSALNLNLSLDSVNRDAHLTMSRARASDAAAYWHFCLTADPHTKPVWKQVHMNGTVIRKLAEALRP
jgi:hypothetical protein